MKPRGDSPSPEVTPAPAALGLSQVLTGSPESSPPRGRLGGRRPCRGQAGWPGARSRPGCLAPTLMGLSVRDILTVQCAGRANVPQLRGHGSSTRTCWRDAGCLGKPGSRQKGWGQAQPGPGSACRAPRRRRGLVLPAASSPSCRHPWAACFLPQVRPASLTKLHVASSNRSDSTTQNQCPKGTPPARMGAPARPPPHPPPPPSLARFPPSALLPLPPGLAEDPASARPVSAETAS